MWHGPRLKFAHARVKLEDAAALLFTNWGDNWGHSVYCSLVDYWCGPTKRRAPETTFALLPPLLSLHEEMERNPWDPIPFSRFSLQPHDAVPEGEVWLVPPRFLRSL
jgi:hypothetical protein